MKQSEIKELVNVARLLYIQKYQWATLSPSVLRKFMIEICETDLNVAEKNLPSEEEIGVALDGHKDSFYQDLKYELSPLLKMVVMRCAHDAIKGNTRAARIVLDYFKEDVGEAGGTSGGLPPIVFSTGFNSDRYEEIQDTSEGAKERTEGIEGTEGSPQIEEGHDGDGDS